MASIAQVARMVELYEAGHSSVEVAEALGLHPTTVRTHLRASGVVMRPTGRHVTLRPPPDDELAEALARLRSTSALARYYGVSATTASRWVAALEAVSDRPGPRTLPRGFSDEPPPREDLVVAHHRDRLSPAQIAARYGVSAGLVRLWLAARRVDRIEPQRTAAVRGAVTRRDSAARQVQAGGDLDTVVAHEHRPPQRWPSSAFRADITVEDVADLDARGMTVKAMARRLGCSAGLVRYRLDGRGPRRTPLSDGPRH